jgi:hypothetical protein
VSESPLVNVTLLHASGNTLVDEELHFDPALLGPSRRVFSLEAAGWVSPIAPPVDNVTLGLTRCLHN